MVGLLPALQGLGRKLRKAGSPWLDDNRRNICPETQLSLHEWISGIGARGPFSDNQLAPRGVLAVRAR